MTQNAVQEIDKLAALFVKARDLWRNIDEKSENQHCLDEIAVRNVYSMVKDTNGYVKDVQSK